MEVEKIRLLVVDDDSFVRDLLTYILEAHGYGVVTAVNGQEAYDRYVEDQGFSLVISDMNMPVLSGLEMTKQLRSDGFDVPVLILTGNMDISVAIEALKNGVGDYILKTEDIQDSIILAVDNMLEKKRLREQNKTLEQLVAERTKELNATLLKVKTANRLIRQTFGRYLSEDVVDDILSSPDGASLGGESRLITIMMSDLRGFTAISERLPAKDVLNMINIYLERMTEVVMKYNGTIIEFIGDAILAVFGAPILRGDDAIRGVACAIEMQNAMSDVNARCRELGYPEIEQGIGINTGESVVGNIGSDKRTKYGLVGMNVNLTGRIETYTVGGQILISESTAEACGPLLRVKDTLEVMPKGVKAPIKLFSAEGMEGDYNVSLQTSVAEHIELRKALPIGFIVLEGKHATREMNKGVITKLSSKEAFIESEMLTDLLSNLKLTMTGYDGNEVTSELYAKVVETYPNSNSPFKVNFTSVPPAARNFIDGILLDNGIS